MKKIAIVIPARYGSTRFEGKPLYPICGKPMIQHVYEKAMEAACAGLVIVATDDRRIVDVVEGFGGKAIMTSASHKSGSDRLVEVAHSLDFPWYINLQGDEPLIEPHVLDLMAGEMEKSPEVGMFSLMRLLTDMDEFLNPNAVKVVIDNRGFALYFSRSPVPCPKGGLSSLGRVHSTDLHILSNVLIHCGIYGYSRDFLLALPSLKPSVLEEIEGLEQLRVLANGHRIKMLLTAYRSLGVDTPEDVKRVEEVLRTGKGQ